jgi:hypothetical protein
MIRRRPLWQSHVDDPDPPWLRNLDSILSFRWLGFLLLLPLIIPLFLWFQVRVRRAERAWTPPPPSRRPPTLRFDCLACDSDHIEVVLKIVDTFAENPSAYQRKTLVRCLDCRAAYVEYNAFDSFCVFSHDARPNYDELHRLSAGAAQVMLAAVARQCPAALDPRCDCALHAALRNDIRAEPQASHPAARPGRTPCGRHK